MNNCNIKRLPENLFRNLRNLKSLYLQFNDLSHLPKNLFAGNLQLEGINLNGNELQTIDIDFTKLLKIKIVYLFDNGCINEGYSKAKPYQSTYTSVREFQAKIKSDCIKTDSQSK